MLGKWKGIGLAVVALMLALTGCGSNSSGDSAGGAGQSGGSSQPAKVEVSTNPVTLTFFVSGVKLTDTEFQLFMVDPLQKKYPYITLQKLDGKLEDLVAGNQTPDMILTDNDWFQPIQKLGIPLELSDMTKKFSLDLGQFVPESIAAIRNLVDGSKLYSIPFSMNAGEMFYNKDIFDKFGVSYPKDNMTWDDVLALSRKITREENGKNYVGWDPGLPDAVESPFVQPFVDPKTNKAVIDTPIYKKVFDMIKQQYDMPGFVGPKAKYIYGPDAFIKDQNLAMITEWHIKMTGPLIDAYNDNTFKNWDMATIPNFPENAGKGRHALTSMLLVSQTSKYKDQAMQVILTTIAKDTQIIQSRNARIPVLTDQDVIKQYGLDVPALKGKNTAAVFKFKWSPTPTPNINDKDVQPIIRALRKSLSVDKVDVNTALRDAQAAADKKLAELAAQ